MKKIKRKNKFLQNLIFSQKQKDKSQKYLKNEQAENINENNSIIWYINFNIKILFLPFIKLLLKKTLMQYIS